MKTVSLVIPAFNEEQRLPETLRVLKLYAEMNLTDWTVQEVLIVDDGSTDQTKSVIESWHRQWPCVRGLGYQTNRGKGAAIRRGLLETGAEWILIADADMATPWEELQRFSAYTDQYDLIMGSRALPESDIQVRQHWLRQSMGKIFNKILRRVTGLPFRDTQCGFKLLRNDSIFREKVLPELKIDRFAWDVELIWRMILINKRVCEVPIRWLHREASRVRLLVDSLEMLLSLLKLRTKLRKKA
ncbi:MAG: dolichyl-phosphate beta-glucosyltransferase [Bdellovibrio sp.]